MAAQSRTKNWNALLNGIIVTNYFDIIIIIIITKCGSTK